MLNNKEELIHILNEIKEFLKISKNDFLWSKWKSSQDAIEDLNKIIINIEMEDNSVKKEIETLFAPTGSLQEVSISGGWGREFIELSREFDEERKKYKKLIDAKI